MYISATLILNVILIKFPDVIISRVHSIPTIAASGANILIETEAIVIIPFFLREYGMDFTCLMY